MKKGSWVVWVKGGRWHGRRFMLLRSATAFRAAAVAGGATWAGVVDVW